MKHSHTSLGRLISSLGKSHFTASVGHKHYLSCSFEYLQIWVHHGDDVPVGISRVVDSL